MDPPRSRPSAFEAGTRRALRQPGIAGAVAYAALAGALGILMVSETVVQCRGGSWTGDFWEHSAVVRELADHLVHPRQPLLGIDAPHAFFSPYALALGAISRITDISSVNMLGAAGIANLVLLLTALPRFVKLFSAESYAPFLTLFFTLVLWGHALNYSGFLHFDMIGLALPYPSTFAFALALWTFVLWAERPEQRSWARVAAVAGFAAVVLLTHPVVSAFLVPLLVTSSLRRLRADVAALAATGGAMLLAAALWPYYPFFSLLHQEGVFDALNRPLYEGVLREVFPALLGAPLLAARLHRDRRDPLALTFFVLVSVYAVGYVTSRWSLGRVLPLGVLILDLVLADRIASRLGSGLRGAATTVIFCTLILVPTSHWLTLQGPFVRALPHRLFPSLTPVYRTEEIGSEYRRLLKDVPRDSVTMASRTDGWQVPTYAGYIVAAKHPQAFVPSEAARERDVELFFDTATSNATRRKLLCRYGAGYVIVDRDAGGIAPRALAGLARPVRSVGRFVLLRTSCVR